jgi:hypothetical protein
VNFIEYFRMKDEGEPRREEEGDEQRGCSRQRGVDEIAS